MSTPCMHLSLAGAGSLKGRSSSVIARTKSTAWSCNRSVLRRSDRQSAVIVKATSDPLFEVKAQLKARLKDLAKNIDDPILKQAVKEPVAFFGGVFAGVLKLEVDDEPLKDWIERTAETAGVTPEEAQAAAAAKLASREEEGPTEIAIE
mmetsp:Transcript_25966/g.43527  ORF Transcript_25966/g.43527 Transcript_25966/m.43527 type:complete len:149 (+) Transcript_25966:158-604(+)|eukprot:CAMPEP_0198210194 /NCGR_PEP_ID=MMETSP1445-20131203/19948_1 /TAXON_ID=36898 /ORGANISM="Pyramimonas sp., Strain CCMP2087" /LENGTH=148 /DNA_ID=CAMNT_0043884189 /DNA_START=99 /DNA_END=545 /DNA_ORIENTATION=+